MAEVKKVVVSQTAKVADVPTFPLLQSIQKTSSNDSVDKKMEKLQESPSPISVDCF